MSFAVDTANYDWRVFPEDHATLSALKTAQKNLRFPPVILFEGREGIGKKACATFAAALSICSNSQACGSCSECQALLRLEHPEIKFFSGDEKFTTEMATELQEHIEILPEPAPSRETYRLVLLENAERMTVQAANRLLKALEEPHLKARIFLTTQSAADLPATVLSRCVRLPVQALSLDAAMKIARILSSETICPEILEAELTKVAFAPWKWLSNRSQRDKGSELADLIENILSNTRLDAAAVIQFCEEHFRKDNTDTTRLINAVELALGATYKNRLANDRDSVPNIELIKERRALLSEIRRQASRNKIHLNTQLAAESLLSPRLLTRST